MTMAAHAGNISLKEQDITTIRTIFPTKFQTLHNSGATCKPHSYVALSDTHS